MRREITDWWRDFHQNPEVRFEVERRAPTMDLAVQDFVERRVQKIASGTALVPGAVAAVDDQCCYPVTVNAVANTGIAADGTEAVSVRVDRNTPPQIGAEDFSAMLLERSGGIIFLGNGDRAMVNHPADDFDEAAIRFGSG